MSKKIIVLGISDEILIYLVKYFKLNNAEVYLVLNKDEEIPILNDIEKEVVVAKIDNDLNQIKLLLKSIEADIIYNFYGSINEKNYKIENFIENSYLRMILFLEALSQFNSVSFVNLISHNYKIKDEKFSELYRAAENLIIKKCQYYKEYYGVKVITKYRTGDIDEDFKGILEI
ncbi:NAD-dependent epimerase/dehydratase family protein [Caproiciproducens sp. MSJ-32]|uniref:NAD-dependent epimerase/dehydratase family protein n=1 Tax=Caproiciproducens sp. MSJ-32 TaxID=2841527 RepID=UPI001C11A3AB|nr:NAD-dependent epimerase/dehydratase family protein [Caproiciproducens sp. MSJ-32]MBU5454894.1 NAD-dependent dehydratase [Caproiciproducens sp. MSJ-32]